MSEAAVPLINSVWRARDGRRVRVTEIIHTPHATGGWWAKLDVLPPYAPRQRRKSSGRAVEFGPAGFFRKEADFG